MPINQDATPAVSGAMAAAVGGRIRDLRQSRGMSLTALAASTTLGKGTLSELERGQRNPTLDTLFAIATALEVPLSILLAEGPLERPARDAAHAHGQSIDATLLDRWRDDAGVVEVYRMTIDQQTRESLPHAPGVSETVTLIDGTIEVGNNNAPVRLEAPNSHSFAGDHPHVYRGIAPLSVALLVMTYPQTDASPD